MALNKPAQQVSVYVAASKAVDGNTDGVFANGSCTHTQNPVENVTWWKVDLLGFYTVTSVEIFTRTDCCGR